MSNFPAGGNPAPGPFDRQGSPQVTGLEAPATDLPPIQGGYPNQQPPPQQHQTPQANGGAPPAPNSAQQQPPQAPDSSNRPQDPYAHHHSMFGMQPSPYGYNMAPMPSGGHLHHPYGGGQMAGGYNGAMGDPYGASRTPTPGNGNQQQPTQQQQQQPPPHPPHQDPMMYNQQQQQQHRRMYGYGGGRPPDYGIPPYGYNPYAQRDYSTRPTDMSDPYRGGAPDHLDSAGTSALEATSGGAGDPSRYKLPVMKKTMLQKVTSNINKHNKTTARVVVRDGTTIIEDGDEQWYTGCVPLGLDDDKYWLSELQVYLRSNFAEAFGATEEDIAAPMHGRNKPIALGQVGIRCLHCKNDNPAERGQQATSYPSLISGIYNSVQQMLRLHLDCCLSMPPEVRHKIEQLKLSCSSRGGRKQYWVDSARRLGLVDTQHGIHFGRDPFGPLPPLTGPSVNSKEGRTKKKSPSRSPAVAHRDISQPLMVEDPTVEMATAIVAATHSPSQLPIPQPPPPVEDRPLVFPEDQPLISDFLYLTLQQMAPCFLMEADRVGCYKLRQVGFPGLACRHCVGQAGCGRYFPASEASLSQTTTSQTIMNHVRNCRRCPIEIRENLDIMKRNRMRPDGKRSDKPKHGGRKVFFHRLWCRIQNIPITEELNEPKPAKRPKKAAPRKRKKAESDDDESNGSEAESSVEEGSPQGVGGGTMTTRRKAAKVKKLPPWVAGCVRLAKTDDTNWLTDMETFARADLIEVFSHTGEDDLHGYGGRKEPAEGQVGVRCVFCKFLDPAERPNGCVSFPDSLSAINVKVTDMIRLHFPSCPALPDDARQTFKRYKGFDARSSDDSHQYWEDSARDIGLSNIPPAGTRDRDSWGITFRRDPLEPSPADEFDLDQNEDDGEGAAKETTDGALVTEEDRGTCTDQVVLLMRQVRPCRFRKSDRRQGSGTRGRDRALGFPGLCCMHCPTKNTQGRYFPVSAKNLTDNTANTLTLHVMSCSHCPDQIRSSLAYLSHRGILQKAELKGSWKKEFFQKIWDRLHVDREWADGDEGEEEDAEDDNEDPEGDEEEEDNEGDEEEEEGGEGEESGGQMNALIQAAAIWLTNQDAKDKGGKPKGRATAKRAAASGVAAASAAAAGVEPEDEESEDDGERKTRSSKKRRVPSRK